MFQPNPTTTDSSIVPHQRAAQERYLLDIIASGSLDASNSISKATATNQSSKWYRWCTFIKHSGIGDEFLGGIPKYQRTILLSSFAASVRRNQIGTTRENTPPRNCQVLHIVCICVLTGAPLERPEPRVLRSNIPNLTVTNQGLRNDRPKNQTSEIYTSKASTPHLQAEKYTSGHSHWPTDRRRIFICHAFIRLLDKS